MKLELQKKELHKALARAARVANPRSTMPIMGHVLIDAESGVGGEAFVHAMDDTTTVSSSAGIDKGGHGSIALPVKTIAQIVSNLPDGPVTIEGADNNFARVSGGSARYRIAGMAGEDFPPLPTEMDNVGVFGADSLLWMLDRVLHAVAPDEGRPHLNGVALETRGDVIRMVATDGHRIAVADREHTGEQISTLIPLKAARELHTLTKERAGLLICVSLDSGVLHFASKESDFVHLTSKVSDVKFPPYEKVIPKSVKGECVVSCSGLLGAVRRAATILGAKTDGIVLDIDADGIAVRGENNGTGSSDENVDLISCTGSVVVKLNGQYLIDALSVFGDVELTIGFNGELDAVKLSRVDGGDETTCVVMPMRDN